MLTARKFRATLLQHPDRQRPNASGPLKSHAIFVESAYNVYFFLRLQYSVVLTHLVPENVPSVGFGTSMTGAR